jgi:hypothetical protein
VNGDARSEWRAHSMVSLDSARRGRSMESYDVAQSGARPWCISASARNPSSPPPHIECCASWSGPVCARECVRPGTGRCRSEVIAKGGAIEEVALIVHGPVRGHAGRDARGGDAGGGRGLEQMTRRKREMVGSFALTATSARLVTRQLPPLMDWRSQDADRGRARSEARQHIICRAEQFEREDA